MPTSGKLDLCALKKIVQEALGNGNGAPEQEPAEDEAEACISTSRWTLISKYV